MNRIRELREAKGLTQKELGDLVRTTSQSIGRLESGDTKLTQSWLNKIAEALDCSVVDLMVVGVGLDTQPDVELARVPLGIPSLGAILSQRKIQIYRVLTDVLAEAGIRAGETITVDETDVAKEGRKAGDAVIVQGSAPDVLLLRQFVPPALLTTNRFGPNNATLKLNDRSLKLHLVGVVLIADHHEG